MLGPGLQAVLQSRTEAESHCLSCHLQAEFEAGFERGGQTREHAQLAKTLGVAKLIVAVRPSPCSNDSKHIVLFILQSLSNYAMCWQPAGLVALHSLELRTLGAFMPAGTPGYT